MRILIISFLLLVGHVCQAQSYYNRRAPVSKYVSHAEAYNSPTAKALGIKNVPTARQEATVRFVAQHFLDPLREKAGPLFIASFFRNEQLNAAVKGAKTSDHLANNGIAGADIDQDGHPSIKTDNVALFFLIKTRGGFYKLIWEFGTNDRPAWVHVSYSETPMLNTGKKVFKATRFKNKTVYEVIT